MANGNRRKTKMKDVTNPNAKTVESLQNVVDYKRHVIVRIMCYWNHKNRNQKPLAIKPENV